MKRVVSSALNCRLKEFNKVFTIQQEQKTSDGQGGYTKTWSDFATVNGLVFVVDNTKMILDDHIKSKEVKRFEFEHVSGLTPKMRINYNGSIYNILPPQSVIDSDVWSKIVAWKDFAT